jgi:hypothetical protein
MQRSLLKLILKNMKKIITTSAVLFGLAAVFYAGMTLKQTLYEDWCMDNGGLIKQGVYDNCVFKKSPTINKKKSEEVMDLTPPPTLHSTWDVNNDGSNDCENEGICDHTVDYSKARFE